MPEDKDKTYADTFGATGYISEEGIHYDFNSKQIELMILAWRATATDKQKLSLLYKHKNG